MCDVANRVKQLRETLGLSQEEFGLKIDKKKMTISHIENGDNGLSKANVTAICDKFNVNRDWLLTGEGEMFSENKVDPLELLKEEKKLSDFSASLIKAYASLDRGVRDELDNNILKLINALKNAGGGYK